MITKTPFSNSKKIYTSGKIHPIKVAMREIHTADKEIKEALPVYDTSGPYTDPNIDIDVKKGIPKLRQNWIEERKDVEKSNFIFPKGNDKIEFFPILIHQDIIR